MEPTASSDADKLCWRFAPSFARAPTLSLPTSTPTPTSAKQTPRAHARVTVAFDRPSEEAHAMVQPAARSNASSSASAIAHSHSSSSSGSGSASEVVGAGSASGNSSAPTVGSLKPEHDPILVGDRDRNTTGDTCGYYKPQDGAACRQPRTCYDCLNALIADESDGCVLTPMGACQNMDAYVNAHDFRVNRNTTQLSLAYMNYFPSINSTYCEANDAACARCAEIAAVDVMVGTAAPEILIGAYNGSLEPVQRFCLGLEGCVCVAACMPPRWSYNVGEDCSTNYGYVDYSNNDNYRSMLPLFMGIQVALICMVVYRQRAYANRFRPRSGGAEGPYNNVTAIRSPSNRLELTGWRSMQQELIQREKARRGLVSLMSPRTTDANAMQCGIDGVDSDDDDDDIPELPAGYAQAESPANNRRRASTDASIVMLEDERTSDVGRRPTSTSVCEEGETKTY